MPHRTSFPAHTDPPASLVRPLQRSKRTPRSKIPGGLIKNKRGPSNMQSPSLEEVRRNRRFLEALPCSFPPAGRTGQNRGPARLPDPGKGDPARRITRGPAGEQPRKGTDPLGPGTTRSLRSTCPDELSDLSGIPSDQSRSGLAAWPRDRPGGADDPPAGTEPAGCKIRALNERNRGLIENSRQYVRSWLRFS